MNSASPTAIPPGETIRSTGGSRRISLAVWVMAAIVLICIPLRIISYGFLPPDDVLADSAKAVSGKSWPQILVLKNDYTMDNHAGWHALLRQVYQCTGWDDDEIAAFVIVVLASLVCVSALPWMERPEAWLIAFGLGAGLDVFYMPRLMMGRPLLLTIFVLITILFLWKKRGASPPGWGATALMFTGMTLAIYLHGVWYFWAMPVAAFVIAGEFRWAAAAAGCWLAACVVGASLTGHPVTYLSEAWLQATGVISRHSTQNTLVVELRPGGSNINPLLLAGGLVLLRIVGRLPTRPFHKDPVFWMAALGWILEHQAQRFWLDWGAPALWVLMACDIELFLRARLPADSWQRLGACCALAVSVFLMTTNDIESRWTSSLDVPYLSQDDPRLAEWLPGKGGIFYKADMAFFFQTFFHNPTAPWRYMVGYEPVLMPPEDFTTYQRILHNGDNPEAYWPWVAKMRPEDRMVIEARSNPSNYVPALEWKFAVGAMWLGRLPQHGRPAPPAHSQ